MLTARRIVPPTINNSAIIELRQLRTRSALFLDRRKKPGRRKRKKSAIPNRYNDSALRRAMKTAGNADAEGTHGRASQIPTRQRLPREEAKLEIAV